MTIKRIVTIHILLDTEDDAVANKILWTLLTDAGCNTDNSGILDWGYLRDKAGKSQLSQIVEIPDDYDYREADLHAIAMSIL